MVNKGEIFGNLAWLRKINITVDTQHNAQVIQADPILLSQKI